MGQVGRGLATKTETARGINGDGSIDYVTTDTTSYDAVGRTTSVTDAIGRTSTTSYTQSGAGPIIAVKSTSPDPDGSGPATPLVTALTYDPQWGVPLTSTGADGAVSSVTYDNFGRPTAAWAFGHTQANYPSAPNVKYSYTVRNNGANAVTTDTLIANGSYVRQISLLDGLGRSRQTQTQTNDQSISDTGTVTQTAGRIVTDTLYDARGLATDSRGPTFATGAPDTTFTNIAEAQAETQTTTAFDGAGRMTKQTLRALGADKWSTSYSYCGDSTTVTPPAGGTPSTTIVDADGQTTALRQYKAATPTGPYDETKYSYTPDGQIASMTDPAGNTWRYSYDIRGRQIQSSDPDAGTTSQTFDDAGQLLTSTNARNQTLAYTYDALGRKTGMHDDSVAGPLRASWTYDTVRKGYPTSSSRVVGNGTITSSVTAMDEAGNPTATQTVVPQIDNWVEAPLAGTYSASYTYNQDNSLKMATIGTRGPLLDEQVMYRYDSLGRPLSVCGYGCYAGGAIYSSYGNLLQIETGMFTPHDSWTTSVYDHSTDRLTRRYFDRETYPKSDIDIAYNYNNAGDLTKINTTFPQTGSAADTQCFNEDYLQRLTAAWTPSSGDCSATPSVGALGGPAPYWQEWAYDAAGNRTKETTHDTSGDTVKTWQVRAAGSARPHGATSMTVTAPSQSPATTSLGYDADGNVTTRSVTAGSVPGRTSGAIAIPAAVNADQTLAYDAEGNLSGADTTPTPGGGGTSTQYVYDADGSPLVRRDNTMTTLWIGGTELDLDRASGVVSANRTISFDGQDVAVRTGPNQADVNTIWSDLNGTATWQVNDATSALTVRRTLPFGQPRGSQQDQLIGPNGFVGGTNDPENGLVRVGARDYDPASGRFLSPDPLIDPANPVQWNAYAYGNNNPISSPDPSGLMASCNCGGGYGYSQPNQGAPTVPFVPSTGSGKKSNPKPKGHGSKSGGSSSGGGGSSSGGSGSGGAGSYKGGSSGSYGGSTHHGYADHSAGTSYRAVRHHPYVAPPTVTNAWRAQPFAGYGGVGNPFVADITLGTSNCGGYTQCPTFSGTPDEEDRQLNEMGEDVFQALAIIALVVCDVACVPVDEGILVARFVMAERAELEAAAAEAAAARELSLEQGAAKVPKSWGKGLPNAKKVGTRWDDPADPKANGIRIDEGDPNSSWPSQRGEHVVVRSGGRQLGPDGKPLSGSLKDNPEGHIPLSEWLKWRHWNSP